MFKKLITNLPFNPSLLGQVSFYAKRLRKEESIRRLGFGFMALAMFIQMFAVIAPPQKSLAYSNDYIINGLNTKNDILRAWDGQTGDSKVAEIYSKFGLTRADIEGLSMTPNATISSGDADYWTIGRTSLSAVSKAGQIKSIYKNSEIPVNTGSTTVYVRQLKAWDIVNPVNSYKAFRGTKNGKTFYILKDCGNFTTVGVPPITVKPSVEMRKTIDGGPRALKPGDQFNFRFEYRNKTQNSAVAENIVLTDTLDLDHFDIVKGVPAGYTMSGKVLTMNLPNVGYSADFKTALVLTVKLKVALNNGLSICNAASLATSNAGTATSGGSGLCISVINPCPLDSSVPSATDPRCTKPALVCSLTQVDINRTTKEATLKTTVTSSNPALTRVVSYAYNFGDNTSKTNNSNALTDTVKHVYKDGNYAANVSVKYTIGSDTKTTYNVACSANIETIPDQPLTPSKFVQNITQKITEEQTLTTKANGGDVIQYTLKIRNSYTYDRANYTISDYIGDVLDYTDLDMAFLKQEGGTYDAQAKTVTWAAQNIPANSEVIKKFRVTVKNPVPSTNQPGAMTTSFDCVISNKYGTEVSVPINCPAVKSAEYISKQLPNTGAGTSVAIGAVMIVFVGYFFARSRLLGKELELIRVEYSTGGGF